MKDMNDYIYNEPIKQRKEIHTTRNRLENIDGKRGYSFSPGFIINLTLPKKKTIL